MPSPIQLADFCLAIYDPASKWDREWVRGDIRVGGAYLEGRWVLVWRGTEITDIRDLLRDADLIPHSDPELGIVHSGFFFGMMAVAGQIDHDLGVAERECAGHSLGAAMVLLYAARCNARKIIVTSALTFAPPRICWGGAPAQSLLRDLPGTDFAHPSDDVPMMPWPYQSGRTLTMLPQSEDGSALDPIPYHRMSGYRADIATMVFEGGPTFQSPTTPAA